MKCFWNSFNTNWCSTLFFRSNQCNRVKHFDIPMFILLSFWDVVLGWAFIFCSANRMWRWFRSISKDQGSTDNPDRSNMRYIRVLTVASSCFATGDNGQSISAPSSRTTYFFPCPPIHNVFSFISYRYQLKLNHFGPEVFSRVKLFVGLFPLFTNFPLYSYISSL